jgi:tetratricopeptide (TPR) repeat protein
MKHPSRAAFPLSFCALSALAVLVALVFGGCRARPQPLAATAQRGTVLRLVAPSTGLSLQICDPQGTACSQAAVGAAVPAGSVLRTGTRSSAQIALQDGSALALDHDTELQLAGATKHGRLSHGALVLDLAKRSTALTTLDVNEGVVAILAGKIALRAGRDFAILDVVRGQATLSDGTGAPLSVVAGEEARLYRGAAPYVSSGAVLAEAVAFTDRLLEANESGAQSRGLGELTARKPGSSEELRGVVKLASHRVRVRIAGAMARTEIDEIFESSSDDVLEGVYRFPIPADAKIERLALEVDGKLEEGAFVDRERAASIWRGAIVHAAPSSRPRLQDDIVWVPGPWRDPALLEWQRGGQFELKIFPIPKHGQRRVVLAYTEAVRPVGGVRHFNYPLPVDPGGTTQIRHFDVDIELRGQDPRFELRTLGYPLAASERDVARALSFSAEDFTPNGDLSVEWALPTRQSELSAFGYRVGDERYALLTLRPKLPRSTIDQVHATAIVVDSSRSMYGEGFERAKHLAARLARELDPAGPVTVSSCDSTCRNLPAGFIMPGPQAALEVQRFFSAISAEGASDPAQAIAIAKRALDAVPGSPVKDIIYIGDGAATVGPIRPATLTAAVRDALASSRARVTAVAVGSASDLDSLAALARAGGGVVLPYAPGQTLTEASLGVLSATYGSALRDLEVTLPEGLRTVAPEHLDTILAGSEVTLSARMASDSVDGELIVRGKVGDAPFEQRYPVHVAATDSPGNAFVPRVYAAARIADLEQNGGSAAKTEAIALSSRFAVASRYTSLLVLESEAMFRAFGVDAAHDNRRFTGEELAEKSDAEGELPVPVTDAEDAFDAAQNAAARATDSTSLDKKSASSARGGFGSNGSNGALGSMPATGAAEPAPLALPKAAAPAPLKRADSDDGFAEPPPAPSSAPAERAQRADPFEDPPFREPPRRMIPMRRVWDRKGTIHTGDLVPRTASINAVADAERALAAEPNRRSALKKAYSLYSLRGDLDRATALVERWLSKEPLDPEALTARADLAARRGDRELAVRLLGSVVDVRPGDVTNQKRLARLYRWSGRPDLGCRYAMAIAELRSNDAPLLADALRCVRGGNNERWASDALALADEKTAHLAATLSEAPAPDDSRLLGDLRLEVSWFGDVDLDLAILHPDGQRVSWLGAPTRELIAARDVLSHGSEGLSLNGAKPGEYAIEIVRSGATSLPVHGELTVFVAGETRRIPFSMDGQRLTIALVEIKMVPRLVPLDNRRLVIAGGALR